MKFLKYFLYFNVVIFATISTGKTKGSVEKSKSPTEFSKKEIIRQLGKLVDTLKSKSIQSENYQDATNKLETLYYKKINTKNLEILSNIYRSKYDIKNEKLVFENWINRYPQDLKPYLLLANTYKYYAEKLRHCSEYRHYLLNRVVDYRKKEVSYLSQGVIQDQKNREERNFRKKTRKAKKIYKKQAETIYVNLLNSILNPDILKAEGLAKGGSAETAPKLDSKKTKDKAAEDEIAIEDPDFLFSDPISVIKDINKYFKKPEHSERLCFLYSKYGYFSESIKTCRQNINNYPYLPKSYFYYYMLNQENNKKSKQKMLLISLANKFPLSGFIQYEAAKYFVQNNESDLSIKYFMKAIKINPNDEKANFELGKLLFSDKNYNQANKYLKKACMLNPVYLRDLKKFTNLIPVKKDTDRLAYSLFKKSKSACAKDKNRKIKENIKKYKGFCKNL